MAGERTLRRVESLGNFPDAFVAEIAGQPDALRRAADGLAGQRERLDALSRRRAGRVVLTGMGSSYHAAYPAVAVLAERGVLAVHVDAAELLAFRTPALDADAICVVTSQSGRSAEVVRLAETLRERPSSPLLVAVTNGVANPLAASAHLTLDTRAGEESGPSTMTFAASLLALGAIADVLGGADADVAVARAGDRASSAADAIDGLLADGDELAERIAAVARARSVVAILGRGPARAAAEMGALTLKESGVNAEAFAGAAFRHGPYELAGPDLGAIVIATEPETEQPDAAIVEDLRAAGASVAVIGPSVRDPDVRVPELDRIDPSGRVDRADPAGGASVGARGRAGPGCVPTRREGDDACVRGSASR